MTKRDHCMPEYHNPWPHTIELIGPNGERVRIKGGQRLTLTEFYDKYVTRGYVTKIGSTVDSSTINTPLKNISPTLVARSTQINAPIKQPIQQSVFVASKMRPMVGSVARGIKPIDVNVKRHVPHHPITPDKRPIVGKTGLGDATAIYAQNATIAPYRISDGVGIGVLSYNRGSSLQRFVQSIRNTVDLNKTTLFISDDNSTDSYTMKVLDELQQDPRIVVIRNNSNAGIAVNSNRLLRCLSRFEHFFLCNDDVEFITPQWINFYVDRAAAAGLHHLCYRQPGVYGAELGAAETVRGIHVNRVDDKPHGAMLYMTGECLRTIGYFDTKYENYGMEHVDWSLRPAEFNLQPFGFYDVAGSTSYVKIHAEPTSIKNKSSHLKNNRLLFNDRQSCQYTPVDTLSTVPKIAYVVPCRDMDRTHSIKSVIMNIVGQSFPEIEIWLVEQDVKRKLRRDIAPLINHLFVDGRGNPLFNKSLAFNAAVAKCESDLIVLHDADMLARVDYTKAIFKSLQNHEAVHICGRVIYVNRGCTDNINAHGRIHDDTSFDRTVDYFEGGSLAVRSSAYWKYGGFNEDYWGYGCEDCDFYTRISSSPTWLCTNEFDLVHLWHGRASGWHAHHKANIATQSALSALPVAYRIKLQHRQLTTLGYEINDNSRG